MATKKTSVKKEAPKDTSITCGDCDKKWPEGTTHCDCGYEL